MLDVQIAGYDYGKVSRSAGERLSAGMTSCTLVLWIGSETGIALQSSIKKRFVRWITDTVTRPFDQDWLDSQYEIGLRHTPEKNATDQAQRPSVVSLRMLLAFIAPIAQSVHPLLVNLGSLRVM